MKTIEQTAAELERVKPDLKAALDTYLATGKALDDVEEMQEEDPENEGLEKIWDVTYQMHFEAYKTAEKIISNLLEVDPAAARHMVATAAKDILDKIS